MPTKPIITPAPFYLSGGPVGALLLHGYTGSPAEMRLMGDYLNQQGLTVYAPLLPGHGTSVADMNTRSWGEWARAADSALARLARNCQTVFVGGLSMGALLTIYLGAQHPELAGVITFSPAVFVRNWRIHLTPLAKYFVPPQAKKSGGDLQDPEAARLLCSYDFDPPRAAHELLKLMSQARRALPHVRCPLLVVYSTGDITIGATAGQYTYEHAGSPDKQMLVLHRSGHGLTVDREWLQAAERTYQFIQQHTPAQDLAG